jgi:hypothetical protein
VKTAFDVWVEMYYVDLRHSKCACFETLVYRSFETCFVAEECTAAKEGIFAALSKEPLAKFMAWATSNRT